MIEKLEARIAAETEAGREALAVWRETLRRMSGEQRIGKVFELTETARQFMRAGIRHQHPEATEEQIHAMYIDRLLGYHGLSLAKVRQMQAEHAQST